MASSSTLPARAWVAIASVLLLLALAAVLLLNRDDGPEIAEQAADNPLPTATATVTPTALAAEDLTALEPDVQRPNGLTVIDGNIYVACTGDGTLYEVEADSGRTLAYVYGVVDAHTLYAEPVEEGPSLWIPDYGEGSLKHIADHDVETVAEGLEGPWGIAPVEDRGFLVTSQDAGRLSLIGRDGGQTVLLDGLDEPTGVVLDAASGWVYVANAADPDRTVAGYRLETLLGNGESATAEPVIRGLERPTGLALDADGQLYVAYEAEGLGLVARVDPAACRDRGGCEAEEVSLIVDTELPAPLAGLTLSSDGRMYLHTAYDGQVYWAQIAR